MAQAAEADEADALAGPQHVDEAAVDGGAGALQRRGVARRQGRGDLVQVRLVADVVGAEGAGGEGGFAVDVAGGAVDVAAGEAEGALAAGLWRVR